MKKILLLVFMLIANFCFAQESQETANVIPAKSWACEGNPAAINGVANEAMQRKETVFAIFRAGKTETETVNRRRLAYVKKHSLEGWAKFNKAKFVYALGEKSEDEGKIEFYIGGKLSLIVIAPKNRTPCLNCCGDETYYPQNLAKNKKVLRKKQR